MEPQALVVVDVPDSPAERGRVHGTELKDQIMALWENWTAALDKEATTFGVSAKRALSYAREVWPVIKLHAPDSATELEALAEGSGQTLDLIIALNCYDEIGLVAPLEDENSIPKGHCTGAAMRAAEGGAMCGQSWDCPLYYRPVAILRSPTSVTLTFPGIIGGPCLTKSLALTWFTVVPSTPRKAGLPNPILLLEASRRANSTLQAGCQEGC